MSTLVCSLSGSSTKNPVISKKTGHIYEHSTILHHLSISSTCPHTGAPLDSSDLLPLSVSYKQTPITNASYSNPGSLTQKMQHEYQALILEAHMLKSVVKSSRQELAHLLYRQDASQRVIAKLQDEVEGNRNEIARLVAEIRGRKMEV